eukprot:TRINITY_DN3653_c0_g1_i2.p2 TRINITY_DN3653_c0_g1~~TRINITY_DN3653_c0_g1_i2.p2  ORF type:complete len:135 (+),score=24.32 TRINITY_DN3653_c0_g1_i2:918-1322(+)
MEVVSLVTSNLLARGVVCVGDEWNRGGKMCVREIAELLPREKLTKLKNEHGGLQTLLKNQHQIFSVHGGVIRLRDWREEGLGKNSDLFKTKLCWFYANHPQGCPLEVEKCPYAHGDTDTRPRPKYSSVSVSNAK